MPSVAVTTKEIKKITGSEFSMHTCFIALLTVCYAVNKCRHLTWVWFQDITDCVIEKNIYETSYIKMWHLTDNSKFSTAYPLYTPRKWYKISSPSIVRSTVARKKWPLPVPRTSRGNLGKEGLLAVNGKPLSFWVEIPLDVLTYVRKTTN